MEAQKDPLFQLIKSLNAVEKAYFKKFAGGGEDSNYLRLFDAINASDEYDEQKIVKKFKGEKLLKNLSVTKNYLFDLILDSLRSYHRNKSSALKADNMIGNLRVLYEKGLHSVFAKHLEKAKEFTIANELTFHYLELLELERPLNFSRTKSNIEIQNKQQEELTRMQNRIRISKVNERVLNWMYKNEKVKTEEEKKELDALMDDSVFSEPLEKFNFTGKNSFYSVKSFYYFALGDYAKCIEQKELQFQNYIDNPALKATNEKYFLLVLGNLLSMCYGAGEKEKFTKYFSVMNEEHKVCRENENLIREQKIAFTLLFHKLHNEFTEAVTFLQDNQEHLNTHLAQFSLIRQLDICYNAAVCYFSIKDYKTSLKWLNLILDNKEVDQRESMHCYSRILQLIIHYELENEELVNSLLKSTYRYLSQRKKVYEFEEALLGSMKKIIKSGGGTQNLEIFSALKSELEEIYADPLKRHSMDHFDYIGWLKEKVNASSQSR